MTSPVSKRFAKPEGHRVGLKGGLASLLWRFLRDDLPRSRYLVHVLVLTLVLLASLAGRHLRSASQLDVLSSALSIDNYSGHRANFVRSVRNGGESLVKAPSKETRLMNRPRQDVSLHFVRAGETMNALAKRHGVDIESIAWANDLKEEEPLRAGQLVLIPPVKGVLHVVQPGDAVEKIAALHDADPQAIIDFNQLSNPSQLLVGERLVVPGGRIDSARARFSARGGERNPITEDQPPAMLPARQPTLKDEIPTATPEPSPTPQLAVETASAPGLRRPWTFVVQDGDAVLDLAMRFGITPETIIWANGLGSSAFISVGQELTILPVSGVQHEVTEGDSLDYIAQLYQADVQAIVEANQLSDASSISVGQELIVPGGQLPMPVEVEEEPTPESEAEQAPASRPKPPPTPEPEEAQSEPEVTSEPQPTQEPDTAESSPKTAPDSEGNWDAVSIASEFLGYPYVWGGSGPQGFDCSGLVYYVYAKRLGIPIPRTVESQWGVGMHVALDQLAPGDIVFFRNTYKAGLSHDGLYIGGGRFIHAASETQGVIVSSLSESYWSARYAGATRVY